MSEKEIVFRKINLSNIEEYGRLTTPNKKYHYYNGPYYKKYTDEEHIAYIKDLKDRLSKGEVTEIANIRLIIYKGSTVGCCSFMWRSKETNWAEIGIVIFEESNWGKSIGTKGLKKWIDLVFIEHPEIVRIGLTTWSGNHRMVGLAKKIGLTEEARYKKARIVSGKYYDSVSYGILKEEWEGKRDNND